ncbi:MAG: tyrosine-type recombinase/integrase [Candidatus Methanoperedens sp.]|nr:tyrosine-type recombinase/integrase [Candidatus Methanoperedens sp.]
MEIESFISELEANGRSQHTIQSYKDVIRRLNTFKPIETIGKPDLIRFFKEFEGTDETKRLYQAKIKKIFIDGGKESLVSWIKLIQIKETLRPDDILDTDDINKLIESTDSIYFKAWISFAFESGARFNEIKQLRYKDFKETTEGLVVTIPTSKSDALRPAILLPGSSNYIRNLKAHSMMNESDPVFPMSRQNVAWHLVETRDKAGIQKPITPHKMRHAQATDMTKRNYTDAIIKAKLGWKKDSRMPARYIHLSNNAVIEATLRNGGKMPDSIPITEIKQGDKITLVDAAMQFSKLSEENEEIKKDNQDLKEKIKLMMELMDKQQITLEELKDEAYAKKAYEQSPQGKREKEMIKEIDARIGGRKEYEP